MVCLNSAIIMKKTVIIDSCDAVLFVQVTEELDGVKAEMDEKGTSMTDAGPLVRVKQALTRLKAECTQMDVRIGVVCMCM